MANWKLELTSCKKRDLPGRQSVNNVVCAVYDTTDFDPARGEDML